MDAPGSLHCECPECGEETAHRVLKGRMRKGKSLRVEATAKCSVCGHVHGVTVVEEAPIKVPTIVSWRGGSKRTFLELMPSDEIGEGDEVMGETNLMVTSIECGERRVGRARARDITTLWTKRFDSVRVRFSIARGSRTVSMGVDAAPDEEFEIGTVTQVGNVKVLVHRIRTGGTTLYQGIALARDIVRIYGRIVREHNY